MTLSLEPGVAPRDLDLPQSRILTCSVDMETQGVKGQRCGKPETEREPQFSDAGNNASFSISLYCCTEKPSVGTRQETQPGPTV